MDSHAVIRQLKKIVKETFCLHAHLVKVDWYEVEGRYQKVRYTMRLYECCKCGKRMWVDSRHDPFQFRV